jgi:predicted dehydrogenase
VVSHRVSAGRLPREHWTHDPREGGGRIVGEVCHFVDLAAYLCGAQPRDVTAQALGDGSEPREDDVAATLRFADGSVASIVYAALGDASIPKERVEVFGETGAGVLDDFRTLTLHRGGRAKTSRGRRDKGHAAELAAWVQACRTGTDPWPVADMAAVMRATFAIRDSAQGRSR